MPLINSPSKAAWRTNLKKELGAGKPMDQALAIAYSQQRRARRAAGGLVNFGQALQGMARGGCPCGCGAPAGRCTQRLAGGGLARRLAALRRWTEAVKTDPRLAPTEHYLPMAGDQPHGTFAYRDPADASAVAATLEGGAVAPLLLRRQLGGGPGLLNRRTPAGAELTDPGAYRVGFAHGGKACGCQACLSKGGGSCR